jgi:hypothetical protein
MPKKTLATINSVGNNHNYNKWANALAKKWGISKRTLEQDDYDYKGFYESNPSVANAILKGSRNIHFPDTYKLPSHPTFSEESKYSGSYGNSIGGHWEDNSNDLQRWTYQLSPDQVRKNWNVRRTLEYAGEAEDEGFRITDNRGRYPIINSVVQGGVLPTVTVRSKHKKGGSTNGDYSNNSGIFGNESLDTFTSFLPILGTAQDAYAFYKNPSWANAGWLAASLGSDVFTGGMAGRAIKAFRLANKANDAARAANIAARKTWEASKRSMASGTGRGADNLRNIHALQAAGATRQAAIQKANDALFDAGIKIGIDQGVNAFLNAAQLDMLPDLRSKCKEGGIHIAPSKRGTFTAAATKHGMGVQEFASRVLRNKDSYSPAMVKKANFARNASKWH